MGRRRRTKKENEDIASANYHYGGRMDLKKAGADLLPLLHLENTEAQYYMCGPAGFMAKQREDLVALGVTTAGSTTSDSSRIVFRSSFFFKLCLRWLRESLGVIQHPCQELSAYILIFAPVFFSLQLAR